MKHHYPDCQLGDQCNCDEIDEEEIELPVGIAWAVGEPGDNARVAGVSFLEVSPTASDVLGRLLESVIARHRVEKPS